MICLSVLRADAGFGDDQAEGLFLAQDRVASSEPLT